MELQRPGRRNCLAWHRSPRSSRRARGSRTALGRVGPPAIGTPQPRSSGSIPLAAKIPEFDTTPCPAHGGGMASSVAGAPTPATPSRSPVAPLEADLPTEAVARLELHLFVL